jgi:hypothetical protein
LKHFLETLMAMFNLALGLMIAPVIHNVYVLIEQFYYFNT